MSEDFFGDLGKTITKAAGEVVDKTGDFFESTKLKAQIAGEEKCIDKGYRNIGEVVFRQQAEGAQVSEEVQVLIEEIRKHMEQIAAFREELAQLKGQRVCPSCAAIIDADAAYCPKCGVAVPEEETVDAEMVEDAPEEAAEEAAEEIAGEDAAEDVGAETVEESKEEEA
ncbi:MAG: hypothetical protein PHS82_04155 [Lachnospiraceae bacterium]|nr:hypothetical protein [Lachnospiraceae bacterium]